MLDSTNTRDTAQTLVELTRQAEPFLTRIDDLKEELRNVAPGETFTFPDGSSVKVGTTSEDRTEGVVLKFNEQKFYALNPELRAEMEKLELIGFDPKIVKGRKGSVTVKVATLAS